MIRFHSATQSEKDDKAPYNDDETNEDATVGKASANDHALPAEVYLRLEKACEEYDDSGLRQQEFPKDLSPEA